MPIRTLRLPSSVEICKQTYAPVLERESVKVPKKKIYGKKPTDSVAPLSPNIDNIRIFLTSQKQKNKFTQNLFKIASVRVRVNLI